MAERQRIARDLHDAVSQQLFGLNMMSAAACKTLEHSPQAAKIQLEQISGISVRALGEMRALLLHLRPVELQEDSLCDGIIKLLKELKTKTSLQFQASIDEVAGLTKSAEEHLFRIVQEAVSNVMRHAEASKVKVELREEEDFIYLYISDNGKGFNPQDVKMVSYGIKSMEERCKEIGGVFQIRSKDREGTYIDIKVPQSGRE
ncbi:sensor histidine kinase [Actinomycetes bacterium NPDC127524]